MISLNKKFLLQVFGKYGICLLLSLYLGNWAKAQTKKQQQPNIIFIMSDDHAWQAISAYQADLIRTPHIDRIAKEGALMQKAFVTNALCGPSRSVILTGKYSHINGFRGNQDNFNGDQPTLPKILKEHGYATAIVGKWHLKSQPQGFDYWNILPGQGNYYNPRFTRMGKDTVYKGYVTDITTQLALEWVNSTKKEGKPFFLMLHQKAPHRNQMPPLENLELFNDRKFSVPANFYDQYKDREALQRQKNSMLENLEIDYDNKVPCDSCGKRKKDKWNPQAYAREVNRLTPDEKQIWDKAYQKEYEGFSRIKTKDELVKWQFQRYMEDYLRCVKSVDDNVGKVLKYLDDQGLAENTIVIYMSDHGVFLGEHGLFDKRFMYNESFQTPLMIRYPKQIKAGQQISQFVLNLDIAPTLLDFAGIAVPADMQGGSMKGLFNGKLAKTWRDKVYYHYYEKNYGLSAHYGMMTSQYKLIHFYDPIDSWELYDIKKDPAEMKNLINDPAYAKTLETLKKELKDLKIKFKDGI